MVKPESEKPEEPELELEEGSAKMTLQDIYALFYVLVRQSQEQAKKQGIKSPRMSFDLKVFKTLPKKPILNFLNEDGRLFVWIPGKQKDRKKKSNLYLPENRIITPN